MRQISSSSLKLFTGIAPTYVSPSVPRHITLLFKSHGGHIHPTPLNLPRKLSFVLPADLDSLVDTPSVYAAASMFVVADNNDPMVPNLAQRPIIIIAASWIQASFQADKVLNFQDYMVEPEDYAGPREAIPPGFGEKRKFTVLVGEDKHEAEKQARLQQTQTRQMQQDTPEARRRKRLRTPTPWPTEPRRPLKAKDINALQGGRRGGEGESSDDDKPYIPSPSRWSGKQIGKTPTATLSERPKLTLTPGKAQKSLYDVDEQAGPSTQATSSRVKARKSRFRHLSSSNDDLDHENVHDADLLALERSSSEDQETVPPEIKQEGEEEILDCIDVAPSSSGSRSSRYTGNYEFRDRYAPSLYKHRPGEPQPHGIGRIKLERRTQRNADMTTPRASRVGNRIRLPSAQVDHDRGGAPVRPLER